MIGQTIAHYRVEAKLGEGGMGEVYRARDTRLNRDVALKILPQVFAQDSQRMARFEREAQVLASLNHANIAQIHGLEETDGTKALVLELVGGETLQEQIARGPIPVDEALKIALQICEGLEAAHEKGIIHRDLKPANIKITPEGQVKILDFGLAKALEGETPASDLSHSPTLTHQSTQAGVILGTAAYMSPEQARGKPVDKRTDIWAFGCVLYEMVTGNRAFGSIRTDETVSDVIASVLAREPEWDALPEDISWRLTDLLRRCLVKEPRNRLHDIADARIEINDVSSQEKDTNGAVNYPVVQRRVLIVAVSVCLLGGSTAGIWIGRSLEQTKGDLLADSEGPVIRNEFVLPEGKALAGLEDSYSPRKVALSPDGSKLVFVGQYEDRTRLYIRELDSLKIEAVPDTENALFAFFSPDGESIGFLTSSQVKRVGVDETASQTLCAARNPTGAVWTEDDLIYFSEQEEGILSRVRAQGGRPELVATLANAGSYTRFDGILPGGKWALVTQQESGISFDRGLIYAVSIETGERRLLIKGGYSPLYVAAGYLVFARLGTLRAVHFDPVQLQPRGEPVQILSNVQMESFFGRLEISVSENGTLAFIPGRDAAVGQIAKVSREGEITFLELPEQNYGFFDLSPDQTRLAIHVADVEDFVAVYDIERGELRRLPQERPVGWPVWDPTGDRLIVTIQYGQGTGLGMWEYGSKEMKELISESGLTMVAVGFHPGGDPVSVTGFGNGDWQVGFLTLNPDLRLDWRKSEHREMMATFSPDGKWFAYLSDETGRDEVWVNSYPTGRDPHQISTEGGSEPLWSGSGNLYYRWGDRWMVTRISTSPNLEWSPPIVAWETDLSDTPGHSYDVSSDDEYLYVVKSAYSPDSLRIHLIHNWFEELKRLVPTQ